MCLGIRKGWIQVPPFIHHSGGEAILSSLGLKARDWESWVKNITIKTDPRLVVKIDDIDSYVDEEVNKLLSAQEIFKNEPDKYSNRERTVAEQIFSRLSESGELRAQFEMRATWKYQQYQKGLALAEQLPEPLKALPNYADPPKLWLGNSAIKEKLSELWQEYRNCREASRNPVHSMVVERGPHFLLEWQQAYPTPDFDIYANDLDFLKFYLVAYPEI